MNQSPPKMASATNGSSNNADLLPHSEIRFIDSAEFASITEAQLQAETPESIYRDEELQAFEDRNETFTPLLTPAGERHLFRKLNFLKYSALQKQQRKKKITSTTRLEIERQLQAAEQVRSQIVQANVRLVAAIAHKMATSPDEADEFICEGNLILVNAVDKFDYSKGFRFSTYATHSVQRHLYRLIHRRQRRKRFEVLSPVEVLRNVSGPVSEEPTCHPQIAAAFIERFQECLSTREQMILEERFGLVGDSSATLKAIADKVGLSKERVRQVQMAAIQKLQDLANQLHIHPETCL